MDYHEEANKIVREIKKLQVEKNLRKLDYEKLKMRTVEVTQVEQTKIEDEWKNNSLKSKWIGTPVEQQELAKRLNNMEEMKRDRADLEAMSRQELTLSLDIFEQQEYLNNMRVFRGNIK